MRAALCVFVLLFGCEAGAALGTPCERNGDCPAPLACRAGRCRTECREARDCTIPLDCVLLEPGVGACTLDQDRGCSSSSPCPAPLACVDGSCRQLCERGDECALDMVCGVSACERPAPIGTSSVCEPLSDLGCAQDENCVVLNTTVPFVECVAASSRGAGTVGSGCTSDAECGPSLVCPENNTPSDGTVARTERRCIRVCSLAALSSCGPGSTCVELSAALIGGADPGVPVGFGVCTEACDVLPNTGCPAGESCSVAGIDGARTVAHCRTTLPTARPFDPCGASFQCPFGTLCESGVSPDTERRCRPFCDPVTAPCAAAGSTCRPHDVLTGGRAISLCSTPVP